MNELPFDVQNQFFQVLNKEISVADFEKWLYSKKELEQLLGYDSYIDLISLNFKDRYILHEMAKIVNPFLDFGEFEERKLKNILSDLINRKDDFAKSLIETYYLYCSGYSFFHNLGLGYGLTFSEDFWNFSDWEILTSEQKNGRIDRIYPGVKREAELILQWIDEGKIVLNGEKDEFGQYQFLDKRTNTEEELRTLEKIEIEENKEALHTTVGRFKRAESAKKSFNPFNKLWSWLTGK
ncbi:hypothetical protein [Croceimicrobium sp.]|uniref:hypothetical protein n=1 Tax=Croceimicrobium sp. TaxID=2828340 RepID=UPI003BA8651A